MNGGLRRRLPQGRASEEGAVEARHCRCGPGSLVSCCWSGRALHTLPRRCRGIAVWIVAGGLVRARRLVAWRNSRGGGGGSSGGDCTGGVISGCSDGRSASSLSGGRWIDAGGVPRALPGLIARAEFGRQDIAGKAGRAAGSGGQESVVAGTDTDEVEGLRESVGCNIGCSTGQPAAGVVRLKDGAVGAQGQAWQAEGLSSGIEWTKQASLCLIVLRCKWDGALAAVVVPPPKAARAEARRFQEGVVSHTEPVFGRWQRGGGLLGR